jgi:DNA-binding transcriptional LysR family regulator
MNLQQLRYFLTAADRGSFSAAAAELHLSQPGVSDQVRRLEAELGMPLFTRVGRGLVLTHTGRAFRPHAEQVLAAVERASDSVAEVRQLRGGQVTFGLFRNADYALLPRLLTEFSRRHPAVTVRILGQNSGETTEDVRAGRLEAAIVGGPVDPEGLDVVSVAADDVLPVSVEPRHVREPVHITTLLARPLILYDAQYSYRDTTRRQLQELAQAHGLRVQPRYDVEHVEGALALAARGLGDTMVTRAITRHHSFPRALHVGAFAHPIADHYVLVSRIGAPLSPAARELAAIATEQLRGITRA